MRNNNDQSLINAQEAKSLFQTIRIPLDDKLKKQQAGFNVFNKPFKGVWVSDVSSPNVVATIRFNQRFDSGSDIALRKNMVINHEAQVLDALILGPAQNGEWIELVFGIDTKIDIGNVEQQVTGEVEIGTVSIDKLIATPDNEIYFGERKYSKSWIESKNVFMHKAELTIGANATDGFTDFMWSQANPTPWFNAVTGKTYIAKIHAINLKPTRGLLSSDINIWVSYKLRSQSGVYTLVNPSVLMGFGRVSMGVDTTLYFDGRESLAIPDLLSTDDEIQVSNYFSNTSPTETKIEVTYLVELISAI